jgi:hypothetical protein
MAIPSAKEEHGHGQSQLGALALIDKPEPGWEDSAGAVKVPALRRLFSQHSESSKSTRWMKSADTPFTLD